MRRKTSLELEKPSIRHLLPLKLFFVPEFRILPLFAVDISTCFCAVVLKPWNLSASSTALAVELSQLRPVERCQESAPLNVMCISEGMIPGPANTNSQSQNSRAGNRRKSTYTMMAMLMGKLMACSCHMKDLHQHEASSMAETTLTKLNAMKVESLVGDTTTKSLAAARMVIVEKY